MIKYFSTHRISTVLFLFLFVSGLSSCTNSSRLKWVHLVQEPNFNVSMSIFPTDGSLWTANLYSSYAEEIAPVESGGFVIKYDSPGNETIFTLCASDRIWMVMSNANVVSFDPTTQATSVYNQLASLQPGHGWPSCLAVNDKLIIWQDNRIATYNQSSWEIETLPEANSQIMKIAEDARGDEWLLLADGTIYQKITNNWQVVKKTGIQIKTFSQFAITDDDVAWIGADNKMYCWQLDSPDNPTLILKLPDENNDRFVHIQSSSDSRLWIVANIGIWVYQESALHMLETPQLLENGDKIVKAVIDPLKKRLYVATLDDIFYTDIK